MNVNLDLDLLLFGLLLATLGGLAYYLAPDIGFFLLITCVGGGILLMLWGALGLRGYRRRMWPIGTLLVVDAVLLFKAVATWLASRDGAEALECVALLLTVLLACGVAELLNCLRERRNGEQS